MGEYADDAWDATDPESWMTLPRRPLSRPKPKTCKYCGKGGLWWHQTAGGTWRLHYYTNTAPMELRLHSCLPIQDTDLEEEEPSQ